MPTPPQRIQLSNLLLAPPLPRRIIRHLGHTRLNQPGTNSIAPNPRAHKLVRTRLHQANNSSFRGRVVRRPGIGFEARDGRGADDGAGWVGLGGRGDEHGARGVFGGEEDGEGVYFHDVHESLAIFFPEDFAAGYPGVGEEDVETAVCFEGFGDDFLHGWLVGGVEGARVDGDGGVQGGELALVQVEVRRGEVAEVEGAGTMAGELVG